VFEAGGANFGTPCSTDEGCPVDVFVAQVPTVRGSREKSKYQGTKVYKNAEKN